MVDCSCGRHSGSCGLWLRSRHELCCCDRCLLFATGVSKVGWEKIGEMANDPQKPQVSWSLLHQVLCGWCHGCQPRSYGLFPMSIGPCSSLLLLPVSRVAWYASASEVALRLGGLFRWCYLSRTGCTSLHQYSASWWPFIESWSGVELGTVAHGPLSLSRLVVLRIARAHSLHRFVPFVEQGSCYARTRWIALRRP